MPHTPAGQNSVTGMRTCTECGETKPIEAFVRIKKWPKYVYGRCRACRNRRARERYHSSETIRQAEIARSWRNQLKRKARATETDQSSTEIATI